MSETALNVENDQLSADSPNENAQVLRVPSHGKGQLRVGNPGNSGGRPYSSLKRAMAELRRHPDVQSEIERVAKDAKEKHWPAALKLMTDYDPHKPAERREHSGQVTVSVVVEREGARKTDS